MDDSSPSKPENEVDSPAKDPTLADLIKALRDTERSDDEQTKSQTKSARWSSIATVVIAFFTFVTIGVGVAQWWVLSGTLSEMRGEQRPIVWVGKDLGTPKLIISPTGQGQVFWSFHFSNYGKGFVTSGRLRTFLKIGDRPFEPSFGQTENGNQVAPIAPGQDNFASPVSRPGLTEAKFKQLLERDKSFEMKAIFDYVDSSGNTYETGICLFYFATGAIGFCPGAENNYVR